MNAGTAILLLLPLGDLVMLYPLSHLVGLWMWAWVAGGALLGLLMLRAARDSMRRQRFGRARRASLEALLDNRRTVLAGLLFLWPGVLSDIAAFMLLFTAPPPTATGNWEYPLVLNGRRKAFSDRGVAYSQPQLLLHPAIVQTPGLAHETEQALRQGAFGFGAADACRPSQAEGERHLVEPVPHAHFAVVADVDRAPAAYPEQRQAGGSGEVIGMDVAGVAIFGGAQRRCAGTQSRKRQALARIDARHAQQRQRSGPGTAPTDVTAQPGAQRIFGRDPPRGTRIGRPARPRLVDARATAVAVNPGRPDVDQRPWYDPRRAESRQQAQRARIPDVPGIRRGTVQHAAGQSAQACQRGPVVKIADDRNRTAGAPARRRLFRPAQSEYPEPLSQPGQGAPGDVAGADNEQARRLRV